MTEMLYCKVYRIVIFHNIIVFSLYVCIYVYIHTCIYTHTLSSVFNDPTREITRM